MRRALVGIALVLPLAACGASTPAMRRAAPVVAAPRRVPAPHRRVVSPVAAQRAELRRLLRAGRPVFCGGSRRRLVALTFDDGPGPYTHLALRELRRARAHATFFLVGKSIRLFPALPRREKRVGALGDHTQNHLLLPALGRAAVRHEIAAGLATAQHAAGQAIRLFRPPYGTDTPFVTATARRLGLVEIMWSVDSGDSIGGDFHAIAARVRAGLRPGSIVLFHENHGQTIRALRSLLPYLARHRLRAVSVPELLADDPPTLAQLHRGEGACGLATPRRSVARGARASAPRSRARARRGRRGAGRPRRRA